MTTTDPGAAAANALTARWAATLGQDSAVLSGAGAYVLLALIARFADGAARDELSAVAPEPLEMPASPATRTALGVWARADLAFTAEFTAAVPEERRGLLTGQDALDAWADEQTGGLIPRMPISVTDDTRLVLASALSVRTAWDHPFTDGRLTGQGPWADRDLAGLFRTQLGERALAALRVVPGLTLYTVRGEQDVDVVLVLGEADATAATVLPEAIGALGSDVRLAAEDGPGVSVAEFEANDPEPELRLQTARFKVEASHDLLEHAGVFGLTAATDDSEGHFPGISPEPLCVSQARQDALAEFTADGFEAAAVTAMGMVAAGAFMPRERFRKRAVTVAFDRPFGFLAVHRTTGLVLVAGWVADPEAYRELW